MNTKTKSLLESLIDITPSKDNTLIIESRGSHVISSAITLLETINELYGEEKALEMEKRLLGAIRCRNSEKFSKGLKEIK